MNREEKFREARRIHAALMSHGSEHLDLISSAATFSSLDSLLERLAEEVICLRRTRTDVL